MLLDGKEIEPRVRRNPLIVTQSDISAFKTCRRQWMVGSYLGLTYKDQPVFGPLALGSRVHLALQHYYADGVDLVAAYNSIAQQEQERLDASGILYDKTAWQAETELGRIMLEGYLEWLAETGADSDYDVIGAENKLTYQLEIDGVLIELRGKVDLRVRSTLNGARLVLDHKTTGNFAVLTSKADKNEQLLFYMLLERLNGTDQDKWVQGAVFNMLRKVRRDVMSRPPYYQRLEVRHNETTLRSYWARLYGTLQDYVRVVKALDEGQDHKTAAYPTAGDQCRWCPAKAICGLMDDGSRVGDMVNDLYSQRDPHERYEEKAGAL